MTRVFCAVLLAILIAVLSLPAAGEVSLPRYAGVFHVAPGGDDASPGTADKPFRTIARAQQAVRGLARIDGPVLVRLHAGTYGLDRTLVFDSADSGPGQPDAGNMIIYLGDDNGQTVLSGGRRVMGWVRHKDAIWKAPSPVDDFRQLYVNGQRAVCGRAGRCPPGWNWSTTRDTG